MTWPQPHLCVFSVAAVVLASTAALLPDDAGGVRSALLSNMDAICFVGAGGLGAALFLIHIYVTVLKRSLQVRAFVGRVRGRHEVDGLGLGSVSHCDTFTSCSMVLSCRREL